MIPLFRDPEFTFRFEDDRLIDRFHLDGVAPGTPVSVFRLDPATGERSSLLARAVTDQDGWVTLDEPLVVRAGDGFVAVPVAG